MTNRTAAAALPFFGEPRANIRIFTCAIELVLGKRVPLLLAMSGEEELHDHGNLEVSTIMSKGKVPVVVCENAASASALVVVVAAAAAAG